MTKLASTSLLLIFFVVSSSHARDLTHRSEYELSIPDSNPSIENEASKSTTDLDQEHTKVNPSETTAFDATEIESDPKFVQLSVPLTYRRGRRGCHHGHNFKRWRSYGNDMIVSNERSSHSAVARWGSDGEWEEDRKHFRHRHHFHHHGEEEEEEHKHKHKEKSGFLRYFRKFLKQFEF